MGFADYIPVILNNIWLYGVLVVGVITLVIFVHELGHYWVARLFGVRAELFSIGFGKEVAGRTDRRGTRWSLRIFPLGGYVRMFGAEDSDALAGLPEAELRSAYCRKPPLVRTAIACAGPLFNFIFAFALLTSPYMILGRPAPDPVVTALEIGGPGHRAGLQLGDRFLSFDGHSIQTFEQAREYLRDRIGVPVKVEVERAGETAVYTITPTLLPGKNSYGHKTERGSLMVIFPNYGLEIREIHRVAGQDTAGKPDLVRKILTEHDGKDVVITFGRDRPSDYLIRVRTDLNPGWKNPEARDFNTLTLGVRPYQAIKRASPALAAEEARLKMLDGINGVLGSLYQIVTGAKKATELGGVIRISTLTAQTAEKPLVIFLTFIALLSVNIGLVNLMPVPLLDGGHILFTLAEAVRGRPVSRATQIYLYGFGLIFLMLTIFTVNMNDLITLLAQGNISP